MAVQQNMNINILPSVDLLGAPYVCVRQSIGLLFVELEYTGDILIKVEL